MLQRFDGVSVRRVIDRGLARVPEHAHGWPVLSLFVMGAYTNQTEIGEEFVSGPSAVLYRAGAAHRNLVGPDGFEQVEIEFDPAWLGSMAIPDVPVQRWVGSDVATQARSLADLCGQDPTENRLRAAVGRFLEHAGRQPLRPRPDWMDVVAIRLRNSPSIGVEDLAKEAHRHPSWLGQAYKRATGEGLLETAARLRVEHAARLLRETDQSFAAIAQDAGFCDQSHMNRTFRRILGRSPSAVRTDRAILRRH